MLRPRVSAIALILVALLGASGCGGDDDGDKPTGALTPAELKSASLTKSDLPDGYELEEQVNSTPSWTPSSSPAARSSATRMTSR